VARRIAVVLATALAVAITQIGSLSPAQAAVKDPVLLAGGTLAQQSDMNSVKSWLQAKGYTVYAMQLAGSPPGTPSIKVSAAAVAAEVARIRKETGAAKVDFVGHSEGGLAGRYYVKFLGGLNEVGRYIDMGTPNYGDLAPLLCQLWQACVDMLPGSAFLTELNAGDPTPGAIPYFHLYSDNGEVGEKNPLPGATNASVQSFCPGRSVIHTKEWDDGAMRQLVDSALAARPLATTCPV
jgi:pimeloyl-ACP methyl ester carboxylesterase